MTIALLVAMMGWFGQDPDPATVLVSQLTSSRSAERESASQQLEAMGDQARAALEAAADSFDLELRAEAAILLDRLDGQSLSHPSRLSLDLKDATPRETAAAITKQTGATFQLDPDDDPRWNAGLVTIRGEMTLWDAVDRLAEASDARLQLPSPRMNGRPRNFIGGNGRRSPPAPDLTLRANPSPSPPISRSGAFRTTILSLKLRQIRNFTQRPNRAGPLPPVDDFRVQLQVRGEPRLTLASVDNVVVREALDDRGQSLLPDSPVSADLSASAPPNEGLQQGNSFSLALQYPSTPGKIISRLSGSVQGLVVGRRGDPLIASLKTLNTPITNGGATLTIEDARLAQNGQMAIVRIKLDGPATSATSPPASGRFDPRAGLKPPPSARGHLDFFDEKGRLCQSVDLGQMMAGLAVGNVMTLSVQPPPGVGPPVEARYHPATWSLVEIPFEFHDVPMP